MDQATQTDKVDEKRTQDRSPSFPYVGLTKAIERTEQLYAHTKRHDIRMVDAAKPAWNLGAKSSGTLQTVAALISFGLIEASGSGDGRKIKISDLAYRAIADPREGARAQALAEAALKPKLIAEFWQAWGDDRPPEATCIGDLHIDRGFTSEGAKAFLRVYDDTIRYIPEAHSDKVDDSHGDKAGDAKLPRIPVAIGDLVQAAPGGVVVFEKVRVRAVEERDGQIYVFVEGSEAGCAMSDVTLLERAAAPPAPPQILPLSSGGPKAGEGLDQFTVDEGVVKITFPEAMTAASVEDLEAFFTLFIKKAKRRAGPA